MAKTNKKRKVAQKNGQNSAPTPSKKVKIDDPIEEEEPIDGTASDEEEIEDEEDFAENSGEEMIEGEEDETGSNPGEVATDLEAFPIEEDDKEGIINTLTQIFLRNAEVSVPDLADAIIEKKFGLVLGPAEDEADDENTNMVYGLVTAIEIDKSKGEAVPKYANQLVNFILERVKKHGLNKELTQQFGEILKGRIGLFINERMLHFPSAIVSHCFSSIRDDLDKMENKFKHVLYIQKIRVAEEENEEPQSSSQGKKQKKGKAEKKRLAAAALANADIFYDNVEDAELFKLTVGKEHHFDYPVHQDIEVGSKFHIIEKDGKKYRPYRRAVIMDSKRFTAFVNEMTTFSE